jgi:dTDP-4-amino-4,6-dideoxygalactose transaminase
MSGKPIYVTRPYMPPLEEFIPFLERIWESGMLSNDGEFHRQLERALCDYLGVAHVTLFNNGTSALIAALRPLDLRGEVITTPYSFVATSHALLWNDLAPVFADIKPGDANIDPARIEAAITPRTVAILGVHCYGNPCDVDAIREIAAARGLKLIYDAAHAFGVRQDGDSLLNHGDLSVLSFHATKVFTTFEGGAVVCNDGDLKRRLDRLRNFGFSGPEAEAVELGLNGKMNEFEAAFGLLQLRHVDRAIARRREIDALYRRLLRGIPGIRCLGFAGAGFSGNHSYFPIAVETPYPLSRDGLYDKLFGLNIHARRYFCPLISKLAMYRDISSARPDNLPVADLLAQQVLCLPIYPALEDASIEEIAELVRGDGK